MKLTPEILKAFESSYVVQHGKLNDKNLGYIIKFQGNPFTNNDRLEVFANEGAAKRELLNFVKLTFWHGDYWQSCKSQIKSHSNYTVDFSSTIKILSSIGSTSRFKLPENKKMFKDFRDQLIKEGIVTIEKIEL